MKFTSPSNALRQPLCPHYPLLLFHYKKCHFGLYVLLGIQKHCDSVCANDVNKLEYHWNARLQFGHCCSSLLHACMLPYSLCCKPVKPGHYIVLRAHILRVLFTLFGKMTLPVDSGIIKYILLLENGPLEPG